MAERKYLDSEGLGVLVEKVKQLVNGRVAYGEEFPAEPIDKETFLYLGEAIPGEYTPAEGLTLDSNPSALGLYEQGGPSGPYVLSADTTANLPLKAWYNGSEVLYTLTGTPEVGAPVYKDTGSGTGYESAGTVTDYNASDGIKASGAAFDGFYGRFDSGDKSGKTYYELHVGIEPGYIYQYNETTDKWVSTAPAGDTFVPISESEIGELFD